MVVMMKLSNVDNLPGGRKRFRLRFPKAVQKVLGKKYFQVPMKAREGAALVIERESLLAEYEKIVAKAKKKAAGEGTLSPLEHWREAVIEVEAMKSGMVGGRDDDERQEILAEDLHSRGADSVLLKALMTPEAEEPAATLLDAKEMYRKRRVTGLRGRYKSNQLERVCGRVEKALGSLGKLPLVDLKRAHGRKLEEAYRKERKKDGSPLAPASVERELNMLVAMVNLAIVEFDLEGKAKNPFIGLETVDPDAPPVSEGRKRDPLPKEVIVSMRSRLKEKAREPALVLIWRLLEGTGCRVSEVAGLRVEDVRLDGAYPHLWVEWHEERRVKTKVSIRAVPLVGDALEAAREALKLAEGEKMLFPRYAREGGYEGVSQALMKHLREVTPDKRHVLHSLRHNMKDWLVLAGVPERIEHRILGHSLGGEGDRVYGGDDAKLQAASEAMQKAIALAP